MITAAIQKFVKEDLQQTTQRFPLPVACCVAFAFIAISLVHSHFEVFLFLPAEWLLPTLGAGFLATLSCALFAQWRGWPHIKGVQMGVLALLVLFSLKWLGDARYTYFFFLIPSLVLMVSVSPFLLRKQDDFLDDECCHFNTNLLVQSFFAALTAGVLGGGLSALIASIQYLFGFDLSDRLYGDVWIFSLVLFAPIYFLANLSQPNPAVKGHEYPYPKGVEFIVTYILSPLVLAYLVILYAYIAKVLLMAELPKGNLAWMITSFGSIGITTYLFAYPLAQRGVYLPSLVCKYFYRALIAPVLLLAVAIYVRIAAYGMTEQRYALIILTLWLGSSALYMSLVKQAVMKNVLAALSILALFASVGPWGATAVSVRSQISRLYAVLDAQHSWKDGVIVKSTEPVPDFETRVVISSAIDFLESHDQYKILAELAGEQNHYPLKSVNAYDYVKKHFGWEYVNQWSRENNRDTSAGISTPLPAKPSFTYHSRVVVFGDTQLIPTKGCDYILHSNISTLPAEVQTLTIHESPYSELDFEVRLSHHSLSYAYETGEEVVFDLDALLTKLNQPHQEGIMRSEAEMRLEKKNKDLQVTISIEAISGRIKNNQYLTDDIAVTACIIELHKPILPPKKDELIGVRTQNPANAVEIHTEFHKF